LLINNLSNAVLQNYRNDFSKIYKSGAATEESYYEIFRVLLNVIFKQDDSYLIQINTTDVWTHNISGTFLDKPDFIVSKRKIPILRIEGKNPNEDIEQNLKYNSNNRLFKQIFRYRGREGQSQPVAITDFQRIWIIKRDSINSLDKDHEIYDIITIINDDFSLNPEAGIKLIEGLNYLTEDLIISISNLQNLINPLAEYAKELHDLILALIIEKSSNSQDETSKNNLLTICNDLKKTIFKDSKIDGFEQFADFFAQTIVYSAFLGWLRFCKEGNLSQNFKMSNLYELLPKGSFIQKIFTNLESILSNTVYKGTILAIENLFSSTLFTVISENIDILMATFYSDFLNLYDAKKAKDLGVVFTPVEIVDYMVDGIDKILKKFFKKDKGILSSNLKFLDPASGTMSYACSVIRKAYAEIELKNPNQPTKIKSDFQNWIKNQFLENFNAFEILMAPCVLGHLKTMITIEDLGCKIDWSEHKLKSYLMNTLMEKPQESLDFFLKNEEIREEILQALYTRHSKEIMIVLGNPPYNISSQNMSRWIENKMKDYKKGLTERNLKILSDDYVKFLRFSQWRITEQSKMGIVSLITNNKYFYGNIFRKMRESFKRGFDIIFTINLHGDMRKGESGNPFDIRVGVGIVFLIRLPNHSDKLCEIYTYDIPDNSQYAKFNKLQEGFQFKNFKLLTDSKYFIEMDSNTMKEREFQSFIDLNLFFNQKPKSGIMTGRDALVVNISKNELIENIDLFYNRNFDRLNQRKIKIKNTKNWRIEAALNKKLDVNPEIIKINYRGFDVRYLYYDSRLIEGHRQGYIDQISIKNPAISTVKSIRGESFSHCLITRHPVEKCFISVNDTSYVFLLKYNDVYNVIIPEEMEFEVTHEQLFYYIYAILNSNIYRERYSSQLLRSYPRIPLFSNESQFIKLSNLGLKLGKAHLFNYDDLNVNQFPISQIKNYKINDNFYYDESEEKIYFGKAKNAYWIGNISPDMWNYKIGGIKQLHNWLFSRRFSQEYKKNRIQRSLTENELNFFLKMCSVIKKSLNFINQIDLIVDRLFNDLF